MAILSRGCKPDNFEPSNSIKFSLTNLRGNHSKENSRKLYVFLLVLFTSFTCLSVLLPFNLSVTFFIIIQVFDSILSNIDEVLLVNLYTNMFAFEEFNVHHKDWLTFSGGSDSLDELYYSLSQITLLKWLTFLLGSLTLS